MCVNRVVLFTIYILFRIGNSLVYGENLYHSLINSDIHNDIEWQSLLHFKYGKSTINSNSTFFLYEHGQSDARIEYIATINGLYDIGLIDDESVQCRYPGRIYFIKNKLQIEQDLFTQYECISYNEYIDKVPIDNVYIVFASDDNNNPSSIMGHSFLKLSGIDKDGIFREHAFSFFAIFDTDDMPIINYSKSLFNGTKGMYILTPYKNKINEYINEQGRSLWEFEIEMSSDERWTLKRHLWELKEHEIHYRFIMHNCNTALINVLKLVNRHFDVNNYQIFITPIEYIMQLFNNNKIVNISIIPTVVHRDIINLYGLPDILYTPKSTRLSIAYEKLLHKFVDIKFHPVYKDIHDYQVDSFNEYESKMMSVNIKYNIDKNKLIINSLELLKSKLILDYAITESFSKYLKISLEDNILNDRYSIGPSFEIGRGIGVYTGQTVIYCIGIAGYAYSIKNSIYAAPEFGVIFKSINSIKLTASCVYYYDFLYNIRGYNIKYNFHLDFSLDKDSRLFFEYIKYAGGFEENNLKFGAALHF